jgi:hypothetical protein
MRQVTTIATAGLFCVAVIVLHAMSSNAFAQNARNDAQHTLERPSNSGSSVDDGGGQKIGSGVGADGSAAVGPGSVGPPALGNPNRGMSGYYRNSIGMTPPSGRFGGGRR